MTTYPQHILETVLKLHRGNNAYSIEEIAAEYMVRLSQERWKFMPSSPEEGVCERAEITKRQYIQLYAALKER